MIPPKIKSALYHVINFSCPSSDTSSFDHFANDAESHSSHKNLIWFAGQDNGSMFKSLLSGNVPPKYSLQGVGVLEAQKKICNQKSLIKVN